MSVAADLLAEARRRAGLSQTDLARRAGVPRTVLNAYERGRREPGADALARLLEAAGYRMALRPSVKVLDEERAARILADVLDLAEALPFRRARHLAAPSLARRAG